MNASFLKPVVFSVRLATRWNRYTPKQNGSWIKKELISMGPAYIKMGQLVASRSDVFPEAIISELSSLHDMVPPCSYDQIESIIEEELQSTISDLFLEFSASALNSASIGQVHSAVLKEFPLTKIAVKVQRPFVKDCFDADVGSMIRFSGFLTKVLPRNKELQDMHDVILQSRAMIEEELDFSRECENLNTLRKAFSDDELIVIPRTIKKYSTKRVLLMEYIESVRLSNTVDPNGITRKLMKSIVSGALRHGLIHGDLHPGNVGLIFPESNQKIVLYDCGLLLQIDQSVVRALLSSVLVQDAELLIQTLLEHKLVYIDKEVTGMNQLKRMVLYVICYVDNLSVNALITSISLDPVLNSGKLDFHIDSKLFLLSRTLTLLEGTCKGANKDFAYTDTIVDLVTDFSIISQYIDPRVLLEKSVIDFKKLL